MAGGRGRGLLRRESRRPRLGRASPRRRPLVRGGGRGGGAGAQRPATDARWTGRRPRFGRSRARLRTNGSHAANGDLRRAAGRGATVAPLRIRMLRALGSDFF